jgi:RNA polymerase sigma-70 factor (ECF subfamily)
MRRSSSGEGDGTARASRDGWSRTPAPPTLFGIDELTRLGLQAGAGDRAALATLVARTQADVWRLCRHLGGRADADDLTQEVYARALAALPRFRGESSVRTWLLVIARRTVADTIRRSARARRRQPVAVEHVPDHAGAVALDARIGELEPDRRAAFVLTQLLGLPYAEAAAVCGVPVGTIRSRVARAREQLLATLEDRSGEAGGA